MRNPCQEPTPYQEAMQELRDNVAALREQIVEAYRIIAEAAPDMGMDLHFAAVEWLDQNESIAKGAVKP